MQGFIQDFFVGGGGGQARASASSANLKRFCVVEIRSFCIKCIDEETKRLSFERMMSYITKP